MLYIRGVMLHWLQTQLRRFWSSCSIHGFIDSDGFHVRQWASWKMLYISDLWGGLCWLAKGYHILLEMDSDSFMGAIMTLNQRLDRLHAIVAPAIYAWRSGMAEFDEQPKVFDEFVEELARRLQQSPEELQQQQAWQLQQALQFQKQLSDLQQQVKQFQEQFQLVFGTHRLLIPMARGPYLWNLNLNLSAARPPRMDEIARATSSLASQR